MTAPASAGNAFMSASPRDFRGTGTMSADEVQPLTYASYMGRDSQSVYGKRVFCGKCGLGLGGVYGSGYYGFPKRADDVLAANETSMGFGNLRRNEDRELIYFAFCPWCGVKFVSEWWRDRTIQNERPIDHYQNPGHHKGDTHEFVSASPDPSRAMAGHYLSTTGDELCWCGAVAEPSLLGCTIRHTSADYETVMAARQAEYAARVDDDYDDQDEW
jgi:hypothetical protein